MQLICHIQHLGVLNPKYDLYGVDLTGIDVVPPRR